MRKIILISALTCLLAACGQKAGYEVTGKIEGVSGTVTMLDQYGRRMADSPVNKGKFSFTGETDEPTPVMLSSNGEMIAMFFLEDGKISIAGDIQEGRIEVTGTPANDASTRYDRKFNEFVQAFLADSPADISIFQKESSKLTEQAVEENKENFFGLYMISEMQRDWDGSKILHMLEQVSPALRETSFAKALRDEAEIKRKSDIGQPYIDVTLYDRDGKERALSSYVGEGKYVLLDFWASWCAPCQQEMPYLKEAYSEFHDKGFEIYGVSLDRSQGQWIQMMETLGMNWVNVFHDGLNKATGEYSVVTIPASFLIGPEGTIIAKNLRGEELVRMLGGILGKD